MKTIRWGMLGCGSVCEVKSGPGFRYASHSALVAVASRDPARARAYAARHGVPRIYDSADALVRDPDIDAVYVATPPVSHLPLAVLAARAGKHVYVEKPMAMCHAECLEMIAACRQAGRRLFVAFYRRAMPRFLQVREWIAAGAIGDVRCATIVHHQPAEPAELSRATLPWRVVPGIAGAGKFLDLGVHQFDLLDFLFGPIVEVQGVATNGAGLYDAEDTVTAAWRHERGVLGSGSWCFVAGGSTDRVEIEGSEGRIEFEFFTDAPLRLTTRGETRAVAMPNPPHVQQPFIQSIVDDLNGVAPCPGTPESAARATLVADTILRGYRQTHAG
jgi:predicted dehydrogenase